MIQGSRQPLEARRGMEQSPLEPLWTGQPCQHLDLGLTDLRIVSK